jgi:hypothetical protein
VEGGRAGRREAIGGGRAAAGEVRREERLEEGREEREEPRERPGGAGRGDAVA